MEKEALLLLLAYRHGVRSSEFRSWKDKKATCLECGFFKTLLPEGFSFP